MTEANQEPRSYCFSQKAKAAIKKPRRTKWYSRVDVYMTHDDFAGLAKRAEYNNRSLSGQVRIDIAKANIHG